ncbi:S8 family serine peptidase [Kordia jejudonensis]|uniref:S8 family serine peptidase n=1 Tax=Kordia jejudonensis TaxID=1348245 RepID=UPI000629B46E|nr:S8 family serine peptidase [Kordia jejudonensis]
MKPLQSLILFLLCCFTIISSSAQSIVKPAPIVPSSLVKKQQLTEEEKKDWHFKDIYTDSIPGISLYKTYEFLKDKKGDTIIVAIIDSEIDIDHEDLKDQIWINNNEIPNNNIDDDNNGYVDDIHGWNYVGTKKGDSIFYSSLSCTRVLKKYQSLYNHISQDFIPKTKLDSLYLSAKNIYNEELLWRKEEIEKCKRMIMNFENADIVLKDLLGGSYNIKQLDSLKSVIPKNDSILSYHVGAMSYYMKYNFNPETLEKDIRKEKHAINTLFNFDHKDRMLTNDNSESIKDFPYGNNNVQGTEKVNHGTKVASLIAAKRGNNFGVDGINDNVELMTLSISTSGDEFDKDIALAIKYAVNNDAKVINMSIGKPFSLHQEWINEAIKYAEKKDVLIISSAGNSALNLDYKNDFPNDTYNSKEISNNFIKVGGSTYSIDENLISEYTNYSKKIVDITAPADYIKVITREGVDIDYGTSYASAIVSGVASLIRSHYPNLTASEVKQIIMKSGVSYDIMVNTPSMSEEKELVPFSSLSKSGKIVNAYNALLMAEEVSNKKKN